MRSTFFRQVMLPELELASHGKVEKGNFMTGARMTEIYGEILKRYQGYKQDVMNIQVQGM